MERIASNLYDTLIHFVGTREEVYIRQRQYFFLDILSKCAGSGPTEDLTSGSTSEGLVLPGSDVDVMYVMKELIIKPEHYENLKNCDLTLETNNTKPGFVKLRVEHMQRTMDKLNYFRRALTPTGNNKVYLSSLIFRDLFVKRVSLTTFLNTKPHGPCASSTDGKVEYDEMSCFLCKIWPFEAEEWLHRRRINNWPSKKLVKEIVSDGCLIVPIGNPLSQESHMEWRLSFSLAEKKLIHSMNHTQILCYGLLKLYLKHVINNLEDCKDLLCSYFLKTALFYCIEEEQIVWDKHNLIKCFWACFKRIMLWVRQGYCPSFFIKTNNIFESKIFGQHREILTERLRNLYEIGTDTLNQIPVVFTCRSNLLDKKMPGPIISSNWLAEKMPGLIVSSTKNGRELLCDLICFEPSQPAVLDVKHAITTIEISQRNAIRTQLCPLDRIVLRKYLAVCHVVLAQHLYQRIVRSNISNLLKYKQIGQLSRYILHNCTKQDICSGLLQYATLNYNVGKYQKVIQVLKHVLAKFKCFVIYQGSRSFVEDTASYKKLMCEKGYSIEYKIRIASAKKYLCLKRCNFYPIEIENEVKNNDLKIITNIPPKVYCYVLLFLAYHKTGNTELRNRTLDKLFESTNDIHFVSRDEIPLARALLNRCLEIATEQPQLL